MPIPFLAPDDEITDFPEVGTALREPNGLLMAGGNLSPGRLLSAYRSGIFPWYEEGEPILWWSRTRAVLFGLKTFVLLVVFRKLFAVRNMKSPKI